MAGLLDFEDPNTAGAMQLGLGLLNAGGPSRMPVSLGQGIAQGGEMAMGAMRQARQDLLKKKLMQIEAEKGQLTIDQVKKELATDEAFQQEFRNAGKPPDMNRLMQIDPIRAMKLKDSLEPKPFKLGADETMFGADGKPIATGKPKSDSIPSAIKEYQFAVGQGFKGTFEDYQLGQKRASASSTMVKLPEQEKAFESELGKKQASALIEGRAAADDAKQMLETNKVGRQILNKGMVTGFGANAIVGIGQALKTAGIDFGGDATSNSQAYTANMAQNVGKLIKQFGAGTGLSDADREYATKMAGGLITVDEKAIRKILDINDKAALNVIRLHNKRAMGVKTNIPLTVDENSDGWSVVK